MTALALQFTGPREAVALIRSPEFVWLAPLVRK